MHVLKLLIINNLNLLDNLVIPIIFPLEKMQIEKNVFV